MLPKPSTKWATLPSLWSGRYGRVPVVLHWGRLQTTRMVFLFWSVAEQSFLLLIAVACLVIWMSDISGWIQQVSIGGER